MKSLDDIKLEMMVGDPILFLLREAIEGKFEDIPNGDIQGLVGALAQNIIKIVKEN